MKFGESIKEARILRKLTQKDLGEKIGVDPVYISKIEAGKLPADDKVQLLCKILGLDYHRMIQLKYKEKAGITIEIDKTQVRESGVSYLARPIYVISYADAGQGKDYDDMGYPVWSGYDSIPRPPDVKDKNAYALKIVGDSMFPRLKQGEIVVVSPNSQVVSHDIAVIKKSNDEVVIKEVEIKNDHIILKSINPAYSPEILSKDQIKFMHKVIYIKP